MGVKSTAAPSIVNAASDLIVNATNTGTVGNVTINNNAGRVNIAAAGSTLTVTNNKVTAASHIFCNVAFNDVTANSANAVAAAGSFTVTLDVACTAQTAVDFLVVN